MKEMTMREISQNRDIWKVLNPLQTYKIEKRMILIKYEDHDDNWEIHDTIQDQNGDTWFWQEYGSRWEKLKGYRG